MTFFSKIDTIFLMKEDRKKCSELMEDANILMESVDHWNKKMDSVADKLENLSSKDFNTLEEIKEMESLEEEVEKLSRRLDIEYASIEEMEEKIEKQISLNKEKKKSTKKKSPKNPKKSK